MEDIDVSIDDGYLTVKGQRFAPDTKFSKTYSLDPAVIVDKFSASLDSGVLVVTAPKDMKQLEENIRKIPITSAPSIEDDEMEIGAESPAADATAEAEEDAATTTIEMDKSSDTIEEGDETMEKLEAKQDDASEEEDGTAPSDKPEL
mmetsp:Transcript_18910/g.26572  ORF Transcript_18910/g.26572 Transcript_18910/m.26572 type:complete len:147 (+) Transcript_18910:2-442(+)